MKSRFNYLKLILLFLISVSIYGCGSCKGGRCAENETKNNSSSAFSVASSESENSQFNNI